MKFLVDENLHVAIIGWLKQAGHDVVSASQRYTQFTDKDLMRIAEREKRIILTSDTDFGELVFIHKMHPAGVILFRLSDESKEGYLSALEYLCSQYTERLNNNFFVIKGKNIRFRKIA